MEPVVKGHPLHPAIIPIPVGSFPASYMLDIAARITGDDRLYDAAYYNMLIGSLGALPAALTGFLDWQQMQSNDPAKSMANTHGLLNGGLIALYSLNLMLRTRNRRSTLGFLLSTIGTGSLMVSGWLGGEIAYGRGWRVRNAERFELEWQKQHQVGPFAPEGKQPGSTEQEYPPETLKALRDPKNSPEVFEEIKNSNENPFSKTSSKAGSSSRSNNGSKASQTDERPEPAQAASDLKPDAARGKALPQEGFPSQAEGERDISDINLENPRNQQQPGQF
ncbi:MAG TPA: DUF2231 domain-containing protein [Chloroflexia bacterium]|nr:DUF2231 domain-containing protein [Chloroflexia bacterium]